VIVSGTAAQLGAPVQVQSATPVSGP
jgi:hypothetical protein